VKNIEEDEKGRGVNGSDAITEMHMIKLQITIHYI
jgi:predicted transposase YbfD/YdcC